MQTDHTDRDAQIVREALDELESILEDEYSGTDRLEEAMEDVEVARTAFRRILARSRASSSKGVS